MLEMAAAELGKYAARHIRRSAWSSPTCRCGVDFRLRRGRLAIIDGNIKSTKSAKYDYIIVGGGTGGLAVAHRLAEDGRNSVAVIEAGGFYQESGNFSVIPAYGEAAFTSISPDAINESPERDLTWPFVTVPQASAGGAQFRYARGKTLGGTSALHSQNYQRPPVGYHKVWAEQVGDASYEWSNMFRFYQKSTNLTQITDLRAKNASFPPNNLVGETTGPIQISYGTWATPIASWIQRAFRELGVADAPSQINGAILGAQYNPVTQNYDTQTRESSQTSYLDASFNHGRTNLKVYKHSLAQKVIFNSKKEAVGVAVQGFESGHPFVLSADKEVIVSAGAFQSPQLLMVSGVGPKATLQKHNIPVVADRPGVGRNLQDHTIFNVAQEVNVQTYTGLAGDRAAIDLAEKEYKNNSPPRGILASQLGDFLAWENLPAKYRTAFTAQTKADLAQYPADWPEVEYIVASAPFGAAEFSTPKDPKNIFYFTPCLNRPQSRGNIAISSSNMRDQPLINPNLLSTKTDEQVLVATFRRTRDFFNAKSFKPVLIGEELLPGKENVPLDATDEEILTYLKASNSGWSWHASCTCKMGRRDDPMAVVDSEARVYGSGTPSICRLCVGGKGLGRHFEGKMRRLRGFLGTGSKV
ncbi:unnamed protein product [Zymoseptoria tritici ST99CH_3D7]|uniref:Glucose-methanol-choline oxidoreductase N-terminal domain-containing protein n=1 Tax=Zymoseptoria tritici (strain ST99CH_3D7) TaxID=1276538 RepID=A0A1X7S020_ZYMT9|nr:unnamed protein product [Zymoseptoria tritici ST99CH_3D7]